jgi:hypothetical protein
MTNPAAALRAMLQADQVRLRALGHVRALGRPDAWIGAGFVRNAVWDRLHGRPCAPPAGDVDVVWFDPGRPDPAEDAALEVKLRGLDHSLDWSVRNQARMHRRNADKPYASVEDALRHWPETATAVAVRLDERDAIEITAPFGLTDLFALRLRPTPRFRADKFPVYVERIRCKRWLETWPKLVMTAE